MSVRLDLLCSTLILCADGVGRRPGLEPAPTPGSYAAVLSGGDLHQGFVEGSAGRRRLPCIVAWWETQAHCAHCRYWVTCATEVIYSLPGIVATPSLSPPCI